MIVWFDGFDDIQNHTTLASKGYITTGSISSVTSSNTPYNYGRALTFTGTASCVASAWYAPVDNSKVIVGFAYRQNADLSGAAAGSRGKIILSGPSSSVALSVVQDNRFQVEFASSNPLQTVLTPTDTITPNTWQYIELVFNGDGSNPASVELFVDETSVFSDSSITTGATGILDTVRIQSTASDLTFYVDDLYIKDANTSATPLGISRVSTLAPSSNIAVQFVPVGAGTNYQAVSEDIADTGTYVYSVATAASDTYEIQALPFVPAGISGLKQVVYIKKSAGSPTYEHILSNGTNTETSGPFAIQSSYDAKEYVFFPSSPFTSSDWTYTEIDTITSGFSVSGTSSFTPGVAIDVTTTQLEVLGSSFNAVHITSTQIEVLGSTT